ncbi:MAG: hypothetical protein M0036_19070 [Desulfobacteraceae bacterium]|nr:hypothetical protein [Desulfobacteraceae bacterium]
MLAISPRVPEAVIRHILTKYKEEIKRTIGLVGDFTIDYGQGLEFDTGAFVREEFLNHVILESEYMVGFMVVPTN